MWCHDHHVTAAGTLTKEDRSTSLAGARQQMLEALTKRKASKGMPKQASGQLDRLKSQGLPDRSQGPAERDDASAAPSELPSRDTSSSDSARAGQNGARAGPNRPLGSASPGWPQGVSTQPFRSAASASAAAAKPVAPPSEQARGRLERLERLDRGSPRSGNSSGTGAQVKGTTQRAAGPSRLGPGRDTGRSEMPTDQGSARPGKKRRLQVQLFAPLSVSQPARLADVSTMAVTYTLHILTHLI